MFLNISIYFDSNDSQNADLSLGSLKVSLFQKAYAGEVIVPGLCGYWPNRVCRLYWDDMVMLIVNHKN